MIREERFWIISWAAAMGMCLLLLHNVVLGLGKLDTHFSLIWPAYMLVICLPLTMQMLSVHRRQQALMFMAAAFSVVMAGAAAYLGGQCEDTPGDFNVVVVFQMVAIAIICWFILMPFAEHKLSRPHWCNDYLLLYTAAWRNVFKLSSALVFVGLFWGLLSLWASLFKVLRVELFTDLFGNRYFYYPITTIAFGLGLSLYSAKEEMLAGVYRACLNVFAWLLPLVAFILVFFLLALVFQGLEPLWHTGYATGLMLTLLALAIFLFNAAWQDGSGADKFPAWLLTVMASGLVAMPCYIALCAYALNLRVVQHGWSIERIWAALVILLFAIYAVGYAFTVLRRQSPWMHGAKAINISAALAVVVLLVLTCTPLLNPARIAVDNQIARLLANTTPVDQFDFNYLRFQSGKYGNQGLQRLLAINDHPQAALLHERAQAALKKTNRYESNDHDVGMTAEKLLAKLRVYPQGATVDKSLLAYWVNEMNAHRLTLNCFNDKQLCPLVQIDLNADGNNEQVLLDRYQSKVFAIDNGYWQEVGGLIGKSHLLGGDELSQYLDAQALAVQPHKWQDLRIGNEIYTIDDKRH